MLDNKRGAAEVAHARGQRTSSNTGARARRSRVSSEPQPSLAARDAEIREWALDPELTYADIATEFGLAVSSISDISRRAGVRRHGPAKTCRICNERYLAFKDHRHHPRAFDIPDEIIERAAKRHAAGMSWYHIGAWVMGLGFPYANALSASAAMYKRVHGRALSVRDEQVADLP